MNSVKYRIVEVTYFNGDKKYVVEENVGWLLSDFDYVIEYDTVEEAEKCINKLYAATPKSTRVIKEY